MSDGGYTIKNQFAIHFITFAVVQWIDVFSRKDYADILVDSLKYCQANKGLKIHAWCIMTNHVHLIISTQSPNKLSDVLRDLKKFTSNNILKEISKNQHESRKNWMLWIFKKAGENNNKNKDSQFWQQDNHPIECDTNEIIETRLNYLHENPVRARMVWQEQDYVYSSGIDYYTEGKGLIEIDFI
jgi:REP element-mobilizing transposase RayT